MKGAQLDAERKAIVTGASAQELRQLPATWFSVLWWRYGLGDQPPMTIENVGFELGMSTERARTIEIMAIEVLREKPEH